MKVIASGVWTEVAPGVRVYQETGSTAVLGDPIFRVEVTDLERCEDCVLLPCGEHS